MKDKKLYLCGAVTAEPNSIKIFAEQTMRLLGVGYFVVNPHNICAILGVTEWCDCMKAGLMEMLSSDGVALIPSDLPSKGRDLELHIAKELGIEIKTVDEWLELAKEVKE